MRAAREVRLVATGMSFALADDPGTANPALTFRAGERIRLVLKNDAPGLRHDVAIPAWNVALALLLTVLVFGWTGGKLLVGQSYADAKGKVAEQKEARAAKRDERREQKRAEKDAE